MAIEDAGLYVVPLLVAGLCLVPTESGLVTPIKTGIVTVETAPFAPSEPSGFTLEKWQATAEVLLCGIGSGMPYAVSATVISVSVGSITVYELMTPDWEQSYKALVSVLIIAGIFISCQAVLVSLTQFWSQQAQLTDLLSFVWTFGVPNDYAGIVKLVVTHAAYRIPICTPLFRTYYKTMSEEMIESARLDGVTFRRVYRRTVFPLSGPMFAVVLIYQFTQIWNDLLFTPVLVPTEPSPAAPVALTLAGLGTSLEGQDFALRMARAFFVVLSTLAVYIFFGDELAEGAAA